MAAEDDSTKKDGDQNALLGTILCLIASVFQLTSIVFVGKALKLKCSITETYIANQMMECIFSAVALLGMSYHIPTV